MKSLQIFQAQQEENPGALQFQERRRTYQTSCLAYRLSCCLKTRLECQNQDQQQQPLTGGNEIPKFSIRPSFMIDEAKVDVLGIMV